MRKERFTTQLQAVLRLYDSFSGKNVTGNIQIGIEGEGKVLPKGDGFYIVLGKTLPASITISSPIFVTKKIFPQECCQDKLYQIWLAPKTGYPFPPQTGFIKIQTEPEEKVYALCRSAILPMRLIQDAEKDAQTLHLHVECNGNFDGRMMLMEPENHEEKQSFECVKVHSLEQGYCVLEKPLKQAYNKIKTCMYPLFWGYADKNGCCVIAVPAQGKESGCILLRKDGHVISRNMVYTEKRV